MAAPQPRHHGESTARLYYPAGEMVGRAPGVAPSLLTIAFANVIPGQENEFREWYATRHIRHALNVPALVSGQCFQLTHYQMPGAIEAAFTTIAIYQQEDTPESMIESFRSIPAIAFHFPSMDLTRFSESVFRPL